MAAPGGYFIAVGELALFVALADRWVARSRFAAWAVTLLGLAVSVLGNVGHVTGHSLTNRATAAVPPLAAPAALAVCLGVLKRVVQAHLASAAQPEIGTAGSDLVPVPSDVIKAAKASIREPPSPRATRCRPTSCRSVFR